MSRQSRTTPTGGALSARLELLVPAFLAILVALVVRGALGDWSHIHIRWQPLVLGAMLAQLLLFNPPPNQQPWAIHWGQWLLVASIVGLVAAFLRNFIATTHGRYGWLLAGIGAGLNLVVVVANGGQMPVSPQALAATKGESHVVEHAASNEAPARLSSVLIDPHSQLERGEFRVYYQPIVSLITGT